MASLSWKPFALAELPYLGSPGPAPDALLDPYVAWACLTEFRGFVFPVVKPEPPVGTREINVIVELRDPAAAVAGCVAARRMAPFYASPVGGKQPRFATLHLSVDKLGELWRSDAYLGWELGAALRSNDSLAGSAATTASRQSMASVAEPPEPFPSAKVVVGVIDHGQPFLHRQWRAGAEPRIERLWDMGTPAQAPWHVPPSTGHGRELTRREIRSAIRRLRQTGLDETSIYAEYGYLRLGDVPEGEPYFGTHGSHVTDLVAGRIHPLTEETDAAGEAPILFAHLPMETVLDSTGGSLAPKVLDAVRYMLAEVPEDRALVVNLSYGTQAGPHDGSSLIERALDELIGFRQPGFAIVEAAGNSRNAKAHAAVALTPGKSSSLAVRLPDSDLNDSFIEFWYDGPADPAFAPTLSVTDPDGNCSPPCGPGSQLRLDKGGRAVAAIFHFSKVPGGARSMALIGLAGLATRGDSGPRAPAGDWVLTLALPPDAHALTVNVWIERDDLPRGAERLPIGFVELAGTAPLTEADTVANLATGARPIVVGACCLSDGRETAYSSCGPEGPPSRIRPHLLAPGEESPALMGLRAAGVRSGDTFRMGGTSVAAPLVARELVNWLVDNAQAWPSSTREWHAVLDRICETPTGRRLKMRRVRRATSPTAAPGGS